MSNTVDVAVVGATGLVGEAMLEILAERNFPVREVHALASARSVGKKLRFGRRTVEVRELADFDFSRVQLALFSAGASVSAEHVPRAVAAGCVVVDNTSQFRYDDDVPLVVPEVNASAIGEHGRRGIIANPNCSTIQMLVAIQPIHAEVGVERINVATYQAVSGAGRSAVERLARQTGQLMNGRPLDPPGEAQQAFNVIPLIDKLLDNGYTREEMKMHLETRKILGCEISVNATAVRVPVFFGHAEAIHLETRAKISPAKVRALLQNASGVSLLSEAEGGVVPTPAANAAGADAVFVGRIREDISNPRGLNLWVVSDNIRKGAALNSVQIAEILVESYL